MLAKVGNTNTTQLGVGYAPKAVLLGIKIKKLAHQATSNLCNFR